MKTKLLVLFGGRSGEYEVSLISASAVLRNIDAEKYDMIKVGISRDGKWYLFGGDISEIESGRWCDGEMGPGDGPSCLGKGKKI